MKIVLQYNILYCDIRGNKLLDCVTTQGRDTASQAMTQRRQARAACRRWALGRRGACGAGRARGCATMGAAWACLGVLLASRLCTWCTQPVFDPV